MSLDSEPATKLPPAPVSTLEPDGRRWVLVAERSFRQPIDEVWEALTVPDRVAIWGPYRPDRTLDQAGPVQLEMLGVDKQDVIDSQVLAVLAPTRLEMTWGSDTLLWVLESVADGTRLVLRHTFDKRDDAPSYGAGWHLCLAGLTRNLAGESSPPVAGNAAIDNGWAELAQQYSELWGIGFKAH